MPDNSEPQPESSEEHYQIIVQGTCARPGQCRQDFLHFRDGATIGGAQGLAKYQILLVASWMTSSDTCGCTLQPKKHHNDASLVLVTVILSLFT